jgi:D-3-phosphoglycerate dehydrogenase
MSTAIITAHNFPDLEIEREILEETGGKVIESQAQRPQAVIDDAQGASALVVQYARITDTVFRELDSLKAVIKYGIGVDNIDVATATTHGVMVVNVPTYCQDEVAEHALALLLACERKVSLFDSAIKDGTWDWKTGKPIRRLHGGTLGVVGAGRIGRRLVEKATGFGFEVIACDPYVSRSDWNGATDLDFVKFEELLSRSDVVSIHVPLRDETEQLFDANAFRKMKRDAVLINTSRGPVVDTEALYDALTTGRIRAAGLDVLPEEPPAESSLVKLDNVVVTPHAAWYSEDSIITLRRAVAHETARVLRGETPENIVNREALADN